MNRRLQADSDLSLTDYDVLNALADVPGGRLQLTVPAARIGWERSRVSHHVQRMSRRELVPALHRSLVQIHKQVLAAGPFPAPWSSAGSPACTGFLTDALPRSGTHGRRTPPERAGRARGQ